MEIIQFEDKNLAHYSYAIISDGQMALIDPARDPKPYYDCAKEHHAKISAVFETHPHADFVSSHLEIHKAKGAIIYVHHLLGAEYPHKRLFDGAIIPLGRSSLRILYTPGHSPDSISILAIDKTGKDRAVFTGDSLFIGDCGRADLRETAGAVTLARKELLAAQMYHTLREKFLPMKDEVLVYPAHGAGSLCGKGLGTQNVSTMGVEKASNWSLQEMPEEEFIEKLLADQPFVPKYFPFDVGINKKGAVNYFESISKVQKKGNVDPSSLDKNILIIDTRSREKFCAGHLKNSLNLANDNKLETWLGSIVSPGEAFYLVAENVETLSEVIKRIAKIGYEDQIKLAFTISGGNTLTPLFKQEQLRGHEEEYTIVDVRNASEVKDGKVFNHALHIPLHELRERLKEIPTNKPIVVHCAGGYRSAAGSSILQAAFPRMNVFDLGEDIKTFSNNQTKQYA